MAAVMIAAVAVCRFCQQVKSLFEKLNVDAVAIELDGIGEHPRRFQARWRLCDQAASRTHPSSAVRGCRTCHHHTELRFSLTLPPTSVSRRVFKVWCCGGYAVEEQEVQGELEKLTGQRTVPNVFIGAFFVPRTPFAAELVCCAWSGRYPTA